MMVKSPFIHDFQLVPHGDGFFHASAERMFV